MVLEDDRLEPRPIRDVVRKRQRAFVVGFDPESFRSATTRSPAGTKDRPTASTRSSLRPDGASASPRATTCSRSTLTDCSPRSAPPSCIRVPGSPFRAGSPRSHSRHRPSTCSRLIPEAEYPRLVCEGPTVADAFADRGELVRAALRAAGYRHFDYYRARARLPLHVARQVSGLAQSLGAGDRISSSRRPLGACTLDPRRCRLRLVPGHVRRGGIPTEAAVRRVEHRPTAPRSDRGDPPEARAPGVPSRRVPSRAVRRSRRVSSSGSEPAGTAHEKRVPPLVFGWPSDLVESFLEGLVDGDGSTDERRTSIWTTSDGLVARPARPVRRLGLPRRHVLARPRACTDLSGVRSRSTSTSCSPRFRCRIASSSTSATRPDHASGREPRVRVTAMQRISTTSSGDVARRGALTHAPSVARRVPSRPRAPTNSAVSTGSSRAI